MSVSLLSFGLRPDRDKDCHWHSFD